MKPVLRILLATVLISTVVSFIFFQRNNGSHGNTSSSQKNSTEMVQNRNSENSPETVAENLDTPWEIVLLPDGSLLTNQRPGVLTRLRPNSSSFQQENLRIEETIPVGEGGLLGMTVHPNFQENNFVYLYLTSRKNGQLINKVERARIDLERNALTDRTDIITDIPASANHNGGRIAFGPDGMLYVATGDAQNSNLSQETSSLAGKILRLKDDGSIPGDNPFQNAVYALGIRNSQGLAWDDQERLWAVDHGRSGVVSGYDEVNLIEKGKNYGWPAIQGPETREGMESPVIQSGADETWAPADLAIIGDTLIFTGLRGQTLYSAKINGRTLENLKRNFTQEFGRLRALEIGPDEEIYFSTSNRDGRGNPQEKDDKIIKIEKDTLS